MVLGGPRSATTWLSNLLTTDETLCLHDPMLEYSLPQLNTLSVPGKLLGVSCTSLIMWPDWVAAQHCPKILLWRDVGEINKSLDALGLQRLDPGKHAMRMGLIEAPVYHYAEIFKMNVARKICKHLGVPFCPYRFNALVNMRIEPNWAHIPVAKEAVTKLLTRIGEVL